MDLGHFSLKRIETIYLKDQLVGEILHICSSALLRQLCPRLELAFIAAVKSSPYRKCSQ